MHTLAVTTRTETGKRTDGQMPAVVYGPKQEAIPVSVDSREFERVFKQAGESAIVELTGLDKTLQVLIHDVDRDPVKHTPRHADFYAVEKGAKVQVALPLTFEGESMAVKLGGNLVKVMHEVEIEAAPANLPQELVVDITALAAIGDQIHVRDLKAPAGVEILSNLDDVVVLAQEVVEEEETEAAPLDMSAIEVEQKGKADEEASEEGAA